jgi:hypothetical protein
MDKVMSESVQVTLNDRDSWLFMVTSTLKLLTGQNQLYLSLEGCAILVMGHRRVWVMRFSQLATRNVQKRISALRECQKAARYMIWLGSSCPMACCHVSETAPTINYGWKLEWSALMWGFPCTSWAIMVLAMYGTWLFLSNKSPTMFLMHIQLWRKIPAHFYTHKWKFLVCQTWSSSLMSFPPPTFPTHSYTYQGFSKWWEVQTKHGKLVSVRYHPLGHVLFLLP